MSLRLLPPELMSRVDTFGEAYTEERYVPAPCITIPVTDELRRLDAEARAKRDRPFVSAWTLKHELRAENLLTASPRKPLATQRLAPQPAQVIVPAAPAVAAPAPLDLAKADTKLSIQRKHRRYRLKKSARAAAGQPGESSMAIDADFDRQLAVHIATRGCAPMTPQAASDLGEMAAAALEQMRKQEFPCSTPYPTPTLTE